MNLDHINIKQLMILQFFFRLRRSQFVRDELPVKQAARFANNFIRNFYDKKSRRRRSCVVSNINNLIAENIEIPNYKPIYLKKKSNCELSDSPLALRRSSQNYKMGNSVMLFLVKPLPHGL